LSVSAGAITQALQNFTKNGQSFAQIFLIEEDGYSGEVEEWENSLSLVLNIESTTFLCPY